MKVFGAFTSSGLFGDVWDDAEDVRGLGWAAATATNKAATTAATTNEAAAAAEKAAAARDKVILELAH